MKTQSLLPAETAPLGIKPGEAAIFVLPHPDDELLMAGAIDALVAHNVQLHAIYATNGEASTVGDQNFVESGRRQEEALAALDALGVPSVSFLGLPDGRLNQPEPASALASSILAYLTNQQRYHLLTLGLTGYDGHSDHVASHHAALSAARTARKIGKQSIVWGLSKRTGSRTVGIPVNPDVKESILTAHASQFKFGATAQVNEIRARRLYKPLFIEELYLPEAA